MDSSTESFVTVAQIELSYIIQLSLYHIYVLTHCLQELDSASNINKERFLPESAHCRKILSQVLLSPLFLCCH